MIRLLWTGIDSLYLWVYPAPWSPIIGSAELVLWERLFSLWHYNRSFAYTNYCDSRATTLLGVGICTKPNSVYQVLASFINFSFWPPEHLRNDHLSHPPSSPFMQVPVDCHRDLVNLRIPAARGEWKIFQSPLTKSCYLLGTILCYFASLSYMCIRIGCCLIGQGPIVE